MTVRQIQSREFSERRRTILLLLGEKAGLRESVKANFFPGGILIGRLAARPHAAAAGVIFSGQNPCRAQSQNCETKQNLAGSSRCHHRDCVDWLGRVYCWLCINRTQLSALYLQFSTIKQFVLHHRFNHQWLSGCWKPLASLGNCCSDCLGGQYLQRNIF